MEHQVQKLLRHLNIHPIPTPNPFSKIETNCYFIHDSVPTLIDTGIASQQAYQRLSDGLARFGRSIRDVERILLTHGHADHRALSPRIQEESGAQVLYHRAEQAKVIASEKEESARFAQMECFRSMGVPEQLLGDLVDGPSSPLIKPKVHHAIPLAGGEELLFDAMKLKVIHTPGHSAGSVCFLEQEHGLLFSGDTMLPTSHITALMELDLLSLENGYNPLKLHLDSLLHLESLGPLCVLPGHGGAVNDYLSLNEEVRERHRKRRKHILRALRHEPKTLYQICRSVFLFNSHDDLYLALSEVLGNIGILIDEGTITIEQDGRLVFYKKKE
jgi:glyoxylase-like metal-dependent hydrolase (beta-lactamase superfamily II)